jgi:hypothetical protein
MRVLQFEHLIKKTGTIPTSRIRKQIGMINQSFLKTPKAPRMNKAITESWKTYLYMEKYIFMMTGTPHYKEVVN